jgi:antitoxin (DNA-binding transcriptional repressor) of toxin-antitoxin stability system
MVVIAVGIRELKATLSRRLADVKRGEVILVTDRGRVVAELRPPGTAADEPMDDWERAMRRLAAEGRVTLAKKRNDDPSIYRPTGINLPEGTVDRWLDDLREDKF